MNLSSETLSIDPPGATLAAERWGRSGPVVVLLHEGPIAEVGASSRSQSALGLSPSPTSGAASDRPHRRTRRPFSHVEDLFAVIDAVNAAPVYLAETSAGGGIALDACLAAPEAVAGLLLLAPAISGVPQPTLDEDTAAFFRLIDDAQKRGDLEEIARLETWLWLDGPKQCEGRVGGDTRVLALEMNAAYLTSGMPEDAGAGHIDAWSRLEEARVPVTVGSRDLDFPSSPSGAPSWLLGRRRRRTTRSKEWRTCPGWSVRR